MKSLFVRSDVFDHGHCNVAKKWGNKHADDVVDFLRQCISRSDVSNRRVTMDQWLRFCKGNEEAAKQRKVEIPAALLVTYHQINVSGFRMAIGRRFRLCSLKVGLDRQLFEKCEYEWFDPISVSLIDPYPSSDRIQQLVEFAYAFRAYRAVVLVHFYQPEFDVQKAGATRVVRVGDLSHPAMLWAVSLEASQHGVL